MPGCFLLSLNQALGTPSPTIFPHDLDCLCAIVQNQSPHHRHALSFYFNFHSLWLQIQDMRSMVGLISIVVLLRPLMSLLLPHPLRLLFPRWKLLARSLSSSSCTLALLASPSEASAHMLAGNCTPALTHTRPPPPLLPTPPTQLALLLESILRQSRCCRSFQNTEYLLLMPLLPLLQTLSCTMVALPV